MLEEDIGEFWMRECCCRGGKLGEEGEGNGELRGGREGDQLAIGWAHRAHLTTRRLGWLWGPGWPTVIELGPEFLGCIEHIARHYNLSGPDKGMVDAAWN